MSIHPTAIVASSAVVPESCSVGPYSTIGPNVVLGEDCELISHVILDGHLTVGARGRIFPFASVGVAPQDLKYRNEPTRAEIGEETVIRECVTVSRGTAGGGGCTRVGSHCLIMAYAHIGHDSQIGNHCILANAATLAGHVVVEDFAVVGALCPVHQFCRIGKYSFIGGGTTITQDVMPFSLTSAKRETHAFGLNKIGLERRGFTREQLKALQHAYRLFLAAKLNTSQAIERLRNEGLATEDVTYLVEFVEQSQARGVEVSQGPGRELGVTSLEPPKTLGLIAGNGRFPFLLLDAARAHGEEVVVAALKEETDPEMDARAAGDPGVIVHWLSLGELSRLIETFQASGVTRAIMAGQVKHKQIFSSIRPDWRLAKLLLSLRTRNTNMLLGAVAKVLGDEGIELISSTSYLEPLLAKEGILTARSPNERELLDIEYGRGIAAIIAAHDVGQTVVVAGQACVAVEAMEGTDAAILRAGAIMKSLATSAGDEASTSAAPTLDRSLTVVKVAKPKQDLRFDVPVIGVATIETMRQAGATCLALDAVRTLIFDEANVLAQANAAGIAIVAAKNA